MFEKDFWNNLLEKAFLALVAWFLVTLTTDVRTMTTSLNSLNEKMATVITKTASQDDKIKQHDEILLYLQRNAVLKK